LINQGTNQKEIDSYDQLAWRNERQLLHTRILTFCQTNNIGLCTAFFDNAIESSTHDKIVCVCLFDLIPGMDSWQSVNTMCSQLGKICFVVTDNLIEFNDLEFIKFVSYPKLLGVTASYKNIDFTSVTPTKLYNCFIQRVDSTRQSWFYFLHTYDLLDRGYVSLLMKQLSSYSTLVGKELFDYIHYTYQLNKLPHFETAYQSRKNQIPFRNFEEKNNLLSLIADSKYSLVLETYAVEDDGTRWCFTEKSLRAIQFPTIPLLFVQKHGVQKLKNLGFEIGNYMDQLDGQTWHQRQTHLLDLLINDNIDIDWNQLYNQSKHNRDLLESWKVDYQHPAFFDNFYDKVLEH